MKHKIISKQTIDLHNRLVKVELHSLSDEERAAIINVETKTANDSERELVDNYLQFNLGLNVLEILNQKDTIFTLKVFE